MNIVNIYDFDKTIYNGDATVDFFIFCLKKKKISFKKLIVIFLNTILFLLKLRTQKEYKQIFFSFLSDVDNIDECVATFWKEKENNIFEWYLNTNRENDIVISASPNFLLQPICDKLKVYDVIATTMDKRTGLISGENCYGEEKVIRLREKYPTFQVDKFYSDSYSDQPLADISKEKYLVIKGEINDWKKEKNSIFKKIKGTFYNKEFIKFLIVGGVNVFNGVFFALLFNQFFDTNISFILGYLVALTISYLLNTLLIFYKSIGLFKYIKFVISYIPNFIIQNTVVFIMYNVLNIPEIITFSTAAIVSIPVTFFLIKEFAFGSKKK